MLVVLDDESLHALNVVVCSRLKCRPFWSVSFSGQVLSCVFLFWEFLILIRRSSGFTFWCQLHDLLTPPVSDHLFFCESPFMVTLSVSSRHISAWSGRLGTAFSADDASAKEAVVAHGSFLSLQCPRCVPVRGSGRVLLVHIVFCVKTHPSFHRLCLSCMVIVGVLIASWYVYLKLETEDQLNLTCGVYRIVGSGVTVSQFQDVCWWSRWLFLDSTMV